MNKDDRFAVLLCISMALIFISIGIFIIFQYRSEILKCTEVTEGVVVKIIRKNGVTPVVEYMVDGQKVKKQSSTSKTFTLLKQGDSVVVHYNPKNGTMWIEGYDNHFPTYLMGMAFILGGVFICLLPFLAMGNRSTRN